MGGARSLRFMWVAHYKNNEVLPQFDFETGKENYFSDVEKDRLIRFGLYPINPKLGQKMFEHGVTSIPSLVLPSYVIHLDEKDELVFVRRNAIQYGVGKGILQREILYILGKKCRVGRGWKHSIMAINEDGDVELVSDFNYGKPKWSK